jgi:hypothetical protein
MDPRTERIFAGAAGRRRRGKLRRGALTGGVNFPNAAYVPPDHTGNPPEI